MALSCTFNYYKNCISDGDKNQWGDSFRIIAAKGDSSSYPYITKVKFSTGSASKFYKSTKLVLKVTSRSSLSNPSYLACNGYLSAQDYNWVSEIFDIDPNFKSAYGPGDSLKNNYLAKSPPCTDDEGTTTSSTATTNGATFYFVFKTDQLKPDSTYYLYFIRETNSYNGYFEADVESGEISYTETEALSKPTISTDLGLKAPTSGELSLTFTWKAITNASSYNVQVRDSSGTSILSTQSTTSTSYTLKLTNSVNYRGKGIVAYVRAVGSGKYTNSSYANKTIASINALPNSPSVTQNGSAVDTLTSISFTVSAGTDPEGKTRYTYYSLDGGTTKVSFTSPLTIEHTHQAGGGLKAGSNTISFYTYDGTEYSTATTKTFTATFAPELGEVTVTHTDIQDMEGKTTSKLASATKISFTMLSGTAEAVRVYVRSGSSSSLSGNGTEITTGFNYNSETKTINIPDITKISSITAGHYYQVAFKVKDDVTDSSLSDWSKCAVRRKPLAPRVPTYTGYSNHAVSSYGATAKSNYYKDKVTIKFTCPSASSGYAKINSVVVEAFYDDTSKEYPVNYGVTQATLALTAPSVNASTTFKIKVTDAAGQTNSTMISNLTLIKSSDLVFVSTTTAKAKPENISPLTNETDFLIEHAVANASGSSTIIYKYFIEVEGTSRELTSEQNFSTKIENSTVYVTVPADEINTLLRDNMTPDTINAFNGRVTILAADGFDSTKTLNTNSFTVNFTEPPYFISNTPLFRIKHDYFTSPTTFNTTTGTEITGSSNLNIRMVNSGEGIIFMLPKADDPNKDIKEYRISVARNDFTSSGEMLTYDQVTYSQDLITIPYQTLLDGVKDDGYFYYRYTASNYIKNEYFYFKVQVYDETGQPSKEAVYTSTPIIGCRTTSPAFSTGDVSAERNGDNVTLNYNFSITDLGGSATKDGWSWKFYYDNAPNFQRTITGYTPQASLIIEIAPNQDFDYSKNEVLVSSPIVFTPSSANNWESFNPRQTKFSNFPSTNAKVFARFTLTVSYTLSSGTNLANVVSEPQVRTYFGSVPTVAHRAHKVGINTTTLDKDDVFVIENYQGSRYIVFKGTDVNNAANSYEVRVDLLEGKIYGYKTQGESKVQYLKIDGATIDGGSW